MLVVAGLFIGLISGLVYGWLIDPVEYMDTQANSLRIDYRTDVILMVATIYAREHDMEAAIARLYLLENDDVGSLVAESLVYAREMHFAAQDIEYINLLNESISSINLEDGSQP